MTREEAITDIRDNIKPIVGGKSLDMAIKALKQEPTSPCDVCRYNPPSSGDGKPCSMCPAEATERFKNKLESGYFRKRKEI